MKTNFAAKKHMMVIAILALLPMAAVHASAQNSARVNVPFAFVANHTAMPAGQYEILSSETTLTLIDAGTGRAQAILLTRHEESESIETQGRMTFQISGTRRVLTEVRFAGSNMHSELLVKPKQERVVAQTAEPAIEIAMM
ncbi:MAG TPA: hypothetical protein VGI45_03150 [Terracidiphilus sp.]|jgi:hypothetical protein